MCDGETSTKRMYDGEASKKEYAMMKHRLKDGKITWKRCRNINKPEDKTSHLTMMLRIKVG